MVKYPTKHSNNIQNKRGNNKQQQLRTAPGIQFPEAVRNTVHRQPLPHEGGGAPRRTTSPRRLPPRWPCGALQRVTLFR